MRRMTAMMGALAVMLMASTAFAQTKPNFSGSWTQDAEKTAAANPAPAGGGGGGGGRAGGGGGGRGGGGGAFTLKQDATSLTRTPVTPDGAGTPTVYKLDGSMQTVTMGQGEAKVKAMWEGSTIVIETTRDMGGNMTTTKAVYSMEGDWLVIATTNPGRGGGEPTTRKTYYKKG